jgi:hypothetical protein
LTSVRKNIKFDIEHGVTKQEITEFLDEVRNDPSFSEIRKGEVAKKGYGNYN